MSDTYISPAETGFYYLKTRYYDPTTGRFISSDVYLSTGQGVVGNNSYVYCDNNSVNMMDYGGDSPYSTVLTIIDYYRIHKRVQIEIMKILGLGESIIEKSVYDINTDKYNGRLDVYYRPNNSYYEVKSYKSAYTDKTREQMNRYDSSYALKGKGTVNRETEYINGEFDYGFWKITFESDIDNPGLVTYHYEYVKEREQIAKAVIIVAAVAVVLMSGVPVPIPV